MKTILAVLMLVAARGATLKGTEMNKMMMIPATMLCAVASAMATPTPAPDWTQRKGVIYVVEIVENRAVIVERSVNGTQPFDSQQLAKTPANAKEARRAAMGLIIDALKNKTGEDVNLITLCEEYERANGRVEYKSIVTLDNDYPWFQKDKNESHTY